MNLKQKLEASKRDAQIKRLQRQLIDARKETERVVIDLDRSRRAKFARIVRPQIQMKLPGDRLRIIAGDIHGSRMDRAAVGAFLADVKRLQPHEIILIGDIVDCGGFLAAHHTWGYVAQTIYTYDQDIMAANHFLDQLREAAPSAVIVLLEGNHEQRVEKWCVTTAMRGGNPADAEGLRRRNAPEYLLRLAERGIRYYRMANYYDGLPVPGFIKRGKCLFTHGSFVTAKHATNTIQAKIAGNVVFGNTHREQAERVRRVNVGIVGAWNPGCLCELQPLWLNTNPADWTHGYAVQFVARSENFLHLNVPLVSGKSLLTPFLQSAHEVAA